MAHELTNREMEAFKALANAAGDWNGCPLADDAMELDGPGKALLTNLKKKGLVTTDNDDGCVWVNFTANGKKLAQELRIDLGID